MPQPAQLLQFDRLDYAEAWALQHRLVEDCVAGRRPDTLLLLEHPPVFTVGRSGQPEHWAALRSSGCAVHHVERGGSVTYHGPGQLIAYPIVRLQHFASGPKAFVRLLEDVILRTLSDWGLTGHRAEKLPGVWLGCKGGANGDQSEQQEKIAAVGLRIVKGVTMHGVALNVNVDLAPFSRITPCGIAGCRVTSMEARLGQPLDLGAVRRRVADHFAQVLGLAWRQSEQAEDLGRRLDPEAMMEAELRQ